MDTSPLPGFITRSQAAERCKCSERSLQRYWSKAIQQQDTEVLERLKLRTENGEVFDGTTVTKKLIDQLKNNGRNPTWFVHAAWAMKKYGPRLDDAKERQPQIAPRVGADERGDNPTGSESEVTRLLREQMRERGEEIAYLRDELKIKNEQIQQASDRTRESNVLMKELQTLLSNVQQRALLPLPIQQTPTTQSRSASVDAVIEDQPAQPTVVQQVPKAPPDKARQRSTQDRKRPSKIPSAKPSKTPAGTDAAERQKPKWHEFPTLRKFLSRRR